jgi:hypothetical protein
MSILASGDALRPLGRNDSIATGTPPGMWPLVAASFTWKLSRNGSWATNPMDTVIEVLDQNGAHLILYATKLLCVLHKRFLIFVRQTNRGTCLFVR